MIKAVIFDFFGVICSDNYWRYVKADRQDDSVFRDFAEEVNLGKLDWEDFVAKVASATGTPVESVQEMYEAEKIDPRVVGLLARLKESYKTALLTNAHHDFIEPLLQKGQLGQLFDEVIISSKIGMVKPGAEIFEYALKRLDVKPAETVYLDDLERHVAAARRLGIQAIRYDSFAQAKNDLYLCLKNFS